MKITTFAAMAAVFIGSQSLAGGIEAQDAYARASGPSAKAGAVFMVLKNASDTPVRLIGAQSPSARKAELHTHIMSDGIARMREIEGGILIPAGGEHLFERGSDHVMLMGLTESFEDGNLLEITLQFEAIDPVIIEVPVDNAR